MGVHLAGELASQFHRAHLGTKNAPEGALHEAGDRCLDALEQVHLGTARPTTPGSADDRGAMLRTLRQTGPRKARAATANIAPRIAPRTAPRGLGCAAWADNPASRSGAAHAS